MNIAFLFSGLVVGFLGSFHCVGMCGPIAMALPKGNGSSRNIFSGRILYNLGRIVTYSILGLIVGLIGFSISIKGFQRELSILAGVTIVIIVLITNGSRFSAKVSGVMSKFTNKLKKQFKIFFGGNSPMYLFVIGILNGLLPCGFVYLALAGALSTGHYAGGMIYMFMFGLGTFPAMFTIAMTGHMAGVKFQRLVKKVSPFIAIALALLLIQEEALFRMIVASMNIVLLWLNNNFLITDQYHFI